jgi:hypothetical protein
MDELDERGRPLDPRDPKNRPPTPTREERMRERDRKKGRQEQRRKDRSAAKKGRKPK